jgi:hypothetical protein
MRKRARRSATHFSWTKDVRVKSGQPGHTTPPSAPASQRIGLRSPSWPRAWRASCRALARSQPSQHGRGRGRGRLAIQVDVCVRASRPELLSALRAGEGRSIFDKGNPATTAIFRASPHRVFSTRIGRAEVYQPIPPADGKSPDGPHTHLLPKLLRSGRTHPATAPIPQGWIPCPHVYPAHPQKDGLGAAKLFDRGEHHVFQNALARFGDPELLELKRRVFHSVASGDSPETLSRPASRFARGVIRVALRQLHDLNGSSPILSDWRQKFDLAASASAHDGC